MPELKLNRAKRVAIIKKDDSAEWSTYGELRNKIDTAIKH